MWNDPEEMFRELDRKLDVAEYDLIARLLASYREALMGQGFTRREAMKLVESYSKFIYDMVIEDVISSTSQSDNDVDTDDSDDLE